MLPPVKKKSVLSHRRKKKHLFKTGLDFFACKQCLLSAYFSPDADKKAMDKQDFSWKQPFEDENIFNDELL